MSLRPNPPAEDDTLTDILADDEAVEEMPEERVREAYVKMKLFEVARDYLDARFGSQAFDNHEYERLMQFLEEWDAQGVQMALRVFSDDAYDADFVARVNRPEISMENAEAVVRDVFDAMTRDLPRGKQIALAREKLKSTLRTSGMPRSKIVRATVQDWKAERTE